MWWCVHEELGGFQAEATNFDQERSCGWEEEGLQEEDDLSLGRFYLHQTDLPPLHLLLASLLVSSLTKNGWRNQGGLSSGYIKFIAENGSNDDSYSEEGLALFRVQGSGPENMQAIQVEPVASSLNSSYCYILHDGNIVFTWACNLTTTLDQELMERQLDVIKVWNYHTFLIFVYIYLSIILTTYIWSLALILHKICTVKSELDRSGKW